MPTPCGMEGEKNLLFILILMRQIRLDEPRLGGHRNHIGMDPIDWSQVEMRTEMVLIETTGRATAGEHINRTRMHQESGRQARGRCRRILRLIVGTRVRCRSEGSESGGCQNRVVGFAAAVVRSAGRSGGGGHTCGATSRQRRQI